MVYLPGRESRSTATCSMSTCAAARDRLVPRQVVDELEPELTEDLGLVIGSASGFGRWSVTGEHEQEEMHDPGRSRADPSPDGRRPEHFRTHCRRAPAVAFGFFAGAKAPPPVLVPVGAATPTSCPRAERLFGHRNGQPCAHRRPVGQACAHITGAHPGDKPGLSQPAGGSGPDAPAGRDQHCRPSRGRPGADRSSARPPQRRLRALRLAGGPLCARLGAFGIGSPADTVSDHLVSQRRTVLVDQRAARGAAAHRVHEFTEAGPGLTSERVPGMPQVMDVHAGHFGRVKCLTP
jgi:hypothetical protein